MFTLEGFQKRYEELKESVRVLRAEVRGARAQTQKGTLVTAPATVDVSGAVMAQDDGLLLEPIDPHESFTMQHLRLQFKMELQKKNDEIKKLIANHRGRAQQLENLENDHRVQKKKLEVRIEHQSEKICALEAQLSSRITLHQQELQAQAYAFAAKLRQCEDEKCQQIVAERSEHAASVASMEDRQRAELNKAQVIYVMSLRRAEDAEAKVKELEAELEAMKKQMSDTREMIIKKDEDSNAKIDKIIAVYDDQIRDLKFRLKKEKDELEQVREDLTKQHALELQSYKTQKAREIDQVSTRVRAAMASKEATITQLKEELAKQQEQASRLLDIS